MSDVEYVTPIIAACLISVVLCIILLAAVISRAVTGRRCMKVSLVWLGMSLQIDASNQPGQERKTGEQ